MIQIFRFRLWHVFVLVAAVAVAMWLITQVGMVTGEIEVIQFDTWPRTNLLEQGSKIEVVCIEIRYLHPRELSNASLNLFYGDGAFTEAKNIDVGKRFKFRYRAKPLLWMKQEHPEPKAIASLGLNPADIEEIIHDVRMFPEIEN